MEYPKFDFDKKVNIDSLYTFFTEKYTSGFYFDGEAHDFYEVVCVVEGQVGVTSDASAFTLKCGQAVIHRPNVFHKIWSSGERRAQVIIFSFGGLIDLKKDEIVFNMGGEINKIIALLSEKDETFGFSGKSIVSVRRGKESELSLFVNALERFLIKIIERGEDAVPKTKTAEDYSKVIDILEEHISDELSVSDIASLCCMSCPKLKKLFTKYSGMGVMKYFNSMKMRRAESLLQQGMSVKEVAFAIGFSDQNYFSYAFKKYSGKSPKMYKNI